MPELIQYRYDLGEVLRYQQSLSMVLESPDAEPVAGRAVFETTHTALEEHDDATWTVEVQTRAVSMEGVLGEHVPDFLKERVLVLRLDSDGTLLDTGEGPPAVRLPTFPAEPIEEGDSWTSTDTASGAPMEITYIVQAIEASEEGIVARLVSTGRAVDPAEGLSTSMDSTLAFSVSGGCPLGSTTVIEMSWNDGRKLSMVVENQLLEQGHESVGAYSPMG